MTLGDLRSIVNCNEYIHVWEGKVRIGHSKTWFGNDPTVNRTRHYGPYKPATVVIGSIPARGHGFRCLVYDYKTEMSQMNSHHNFWFWRHFMSKSIGCCPKPEDENLLEDIRLFSLDRGPELRESCLNNMHLILDLNLGCMMAYTMGLNTVDVFAMRPATEVK